LSKIDLRIDEVDLQILKILTLNCRTSYRSIGKTLGISMNTVRTRINNLILNKAIEKFITIINFSLFGYSGDVLTILLKASKNLVHVIDKVAKRMKDWGPVYMHIEIFDGVHVIGIDTCYIHIYN
jgi:DNA-binding Lrp family transcriptional regulator